jgi:hypothetical protein
MSLAEMTTEQQKSLFIRASAIYHSGRAQTVRSATTCTTNSSGT